MLNLSTVLVQNTGECISASRGFSSPPSCLPWLTHLQQQDWQQRGIVVWNADLRIVAHLYAEYALELLGRMRANDAWKSNSFLIGSPTFQLPSNRPGTLSNETVEGLAT